ncbi:hypothetical protein YTPLAS72_07050 [Nitrospira sp.]|nr:hypothetical protein YTPLAS72_07050 [Nitrospira sp.]
MQDNAVADRDTTPNDQRVRVMRDMQHAEVLDVCSVSDPNRVHIATDHSVEPNATLLTHHNITDHDGRRLDKT